MIENAGYQIDRAVQNLKSAGDIKSWDDFMDWYNMQLYLERRAVENFNSMNVTIGKKQYPLADIVDIAYGVKDQYVDYWDREFTEDQRKEMWLGLGLTPSNYAYVQPFRAKAREIAQYGLSAADLQNEWYMRQMRRFEEIQKKLAEDEGKETENKMGEKEVAMLSLEVQMEMYKSLNTIAYHEALRMQKESVDSYLADTPVDSPHLSGMPKDGFRALPAYQEEQ